MPAADATTAQRSSSNRWLTATLVAAALVVMLDNTIINVALPTIGAQLRLGTSELQWLIDSYTLVFSSLLLTMGAVGDRYGKLRLLVVGITTFTAVSLALCFADSYWEVVLGRAALGLSAAMVYPPTLGLMLDVADGGSTDGRDGRRARALAVWTAAGGLGVALGPLFGGWLLEHAQWRIIFAVNVPFGLAALVALAVTGSKWARSSGGEVTTDARIDPLAALLSMVMVGGVVYAIIEAPHDGWGSPVSVTRYAAAVLAVVVFIVQQRIATRMLVPWNSFRRPQMTVGAVALCVGFGVLFGIVFITTLYFQLVRGASPLLAGAMLIPFAVAMAVATPLSAPLARRFGWLVPLVLGALLMAAGLMYFATTTADSPYWTRPALGLIVTGAGFGCFQVTATDAVMSSVPASRYGVGSSINDAAREIGGAIGVAVFGSVLATEISRRSQPSAAGSGSDGIASYFEIFGSAPTEARAALAEVFVPSMAVCIRLGAVTFAVVAVVLIVVAGWRRRNTGT